MAVLVAYASKHGSTEEIATFIGERLGARGIDVVCTDATDANLDGIEAAVVLSGVYAGRWLGSAIQFVRAHHDALRGMPAWLVSSGPVGEDPPPIEELVHVDDLLEAVEPIEHWVVAGRIETDLLGFAERALVRALKVEMGDYRDWDEIRSLADAIADHLLP